MRADARHLRGTGAGDGRGPPGLEVSEVARDLSSAGRSLVAYLIECLSRTEASPAAPPPGELHPDTIAAAVSAVRRAITAQAEGAVADSEMADMHARLDREVLDLERLVLDGQAATHRLLLKEISHDIRSPLNSILFLADALRHGHAGSLNSVQTRQIEVLFSAAVTLVKLVNDLIDYARLGEYGSIEVLDEPFSIETVLRDVGDLLGPLLAYRDVVYRQQVEISGPRKGDPQLLSRVLLNVVSNAVQAVPSDGVVFLRVTETAEGSLCVEVTDNATGTDVERLRLRLDPEADADRTEVRGWTRGLGLAISARLVAAAGGSIRVESLHGEGTCFRIEVPFARE